jgi:hypothetical protein
MGLVSSSAMASEEFGIMSADARGQRISNRMSISLESQPIR